MYEFGIAGPAMLLLVLLTVRLSLDAKEHSTFTHTFDTPPVRWAPNRAKSGWPGRGLGTYIVTYAAIYTYIEIQPILPNFATSLCIIYLPTNLSQVFFMFQARFSTKKRTHKK